MGEAHDSELSGQVIGLAMEVHRHLGPGLLESVYEECLDFELIHAAIPYARQQKLPILYKGSKLAFTYQIDIVVDNKLIIEVKSVDRIAPVHEAQLLTYVRLSGISLGLLLNFSCPVLKDGIRRLRL
jgi:GxxExxY protein